MRAILFATLTITSLHLFAEEVDHDQMDHSKVDHSQHNMDGMDHSKMDHSQHNMEGMDHSSHSGHGGHSSHGGHHGGHHDHKMTLDAEGMVMNWNDDELPKDCAAISDEIDITVKAGTHYSQDFPGTIFGFEQHQINAKPCSKINVTFINEDEVRHQWMVHGLPKYLYERGMFHLEAAGGATKTGSFIVPSDNKTYLVHCDITQHMEKGMKAQLVVGKGDGDLPSVPGISGPWEAPR